MYSLMLLNSLMLLEEVISSSKYLKTNACLKKLKWYKEDQPGPWTGMLQICEMFHNLKIIIKKTKNILWDGKTSNIEIADVWVST